MNCRNSSYLMGFDSDIDKYTAVKKRLETIYFRSKELLNKYETKSSLSYFSNGYSCLISKVLIS